MRTAIKLFYYSVLFSLLASTASAVEVWGRVTGTWTVENSPYQVIGEIEVPYDSTLVIEPGVEVIFEGHYKFNVLLHATLMAVGTESDSILFTASDTTTGWHGIRFLYANGASILKYCRIEYGHAAGYSTEEYGGGIYCYLSNPTIERCTIAHNTAEIGGGICCGYLSAPHIIDNLIQYNTADGYYTHGGGIACNQGATPLIEYNTIDQNCAIGSSPDGGGISCDSSSAVIRCNEITGNWTEDGSGPGLYIGYGCDVEVDQNIISGNYDYSGWGGGISVRYANATIRRNEILNNSTIKGGGISAGEGNILIERNLIAYNTNVQFSSSAENGAGIYLDYSSTAEIRHNTIAFNITPGSGGGIYVYSDETGVTIENNLIYGNTAGSGGGIGTYYYSASISSIHNIVHQNSATDSYGGGIEVSNQSVLLHNIISQNTAEEYGGGIFISDDVEVSDCIICDNTINDASIGRGAGIYSDQYGEPVLNDLYIFNNTGANRGGGIYFYYPELNFEKCTLVNNSAVEGSGMFCYGSTGDIVDARNDILWGHGPQPVGIYGGISVAFAYCDISGGYTGTGNIDLYPEFVDTLLNDYRLQWGSPCIDSGDPHSWYNDPDSTQVDMGAGYYQQNTPVRVLLTPHELPVIMPSEGGTFDYTIRATNCDLASYEFTFWCDAQYGEDFTHGPLVGPRTLTIEAGSTIECVRSQAVPASAPQGVYHYRAFAVVDADTSSDAFLWGKSGLSGGNAEYSHWQNYGDALPGNLDSSYEAPALPPVQTTCFPNPFNPTTTIEFTLRNEQYVTLDVFNLAGSRVADLIEGDYPGGSHRITFDGSKVPSGIYLYRLTVGGQIVRGKLLLIK